jgi:hypothetical protein
MQTTPLSIFYHWCSAEKSYAVQCSIPLVALNPLHRPLVYSMYPFRHKKDQHQKNTNQKISRDSLVCPGRSP